MIASAQAVDSKESCKLAQPKKIAIARLAVKKAKATLKHEEQVLHAYLGQSLIQCSNFAATGKGCGAWSKINTLTYIQTHWYTAPHGCTGGDYWNQGEGQWICPECQHLNRLYNSPEIENLKPHFKCVENKHKD